MCIKLQQQRGLCPSPYKNVKCIYVTFNALTANVSSISLSKTKSALNPAQVRLILLFSIANLNLNAASSGHFAMDFTFQMPGP